MADLGIRTVTLEEKMEEIDKLVAEVYQENRVFTPLYPFVFVLCCSKDQKVGSIYTPQKQNKPAWEGIVLATWGEKIFERGNVDQNGVRVTRCEVKRSELKPGDWIVFPHWAGSGREVYGYDSDRFRLVSEGQGTYGSEVLGTLSIQDRMTKPTRELLEMAAAAHTGREWPALGPEEAALLEAKVEERFMVLERELAGITLSGR